MRLARLAPLACALAACGLFPDLGGLAGSGVGDAAADAKSDVVVMDGPSTDAPIVDSGPTGPCAAAHDFCDDFDQGALGAKWDHSYTDVGPLALSNVAVTPPSSLEATALGSSSTGSSMLEKSFSATAHAHMELDVRVSNPVDTSGSEVDVATFEVTPPAGHSFCVLTLFRYKDASILEAYYEPSDGGASYSIDQNVAEDFTSWRHVALDADFVNQTFALSIDGVPTTQLTMSPAIPQDVFKAQVGATYASGLNGDWQVLIDNVTLDLQ